MCLDAWPLNESEAGVDLVLIDAAVMLAFVGIYKRKVVRFLSKKGRQQLHFHSKARQLRTQLVSWACIQLRAFPVETRLASHSVLRNKKSKQFWILEHGLSGWHSKVSIYFNWPCCISSVPVPWLNSHCPVGDFNRTCTKVVLEPDERPTLQSQSHTLCLQ